MLWFGDTRLINTPVHAADERRVECSLAHEQSGVGGGPVLEVFEGEASRESGNVTWESFVLGVEIDICCMQQRGAGEPPKCLEIFQAEDGIRDVERSRGLGDVYKRQVRLALPLPARRAWRPVPSRRGLRVFGTCTY